NSRRGSFILNLPLASHHSITSSAATSSLSGTVRPSILAVDDQLELAGLYDWQVRRLRALEDATGIDADLTIHIHNVASVGHQPAGLGKFTVPIYRGEPVAPRQEDQRDTPSVEEGVVADEEGVGPLAHKSCEGRIDLPAGTGVEDLDLQSHGAGSGFYGSQRRLGIRCMGRIDEHCNTSGYRHQRTQELQPLCGQLPNEKIDTCQIAARPGKAGHKTK